MNLLTVHFLRVLQLTVLLVHLGWHLKAAPLQPVAKIIIHEFLKLFCILTPLIPVHVPPLQLLDEAHQALGESVEHGVRGVAEVCGVECLDGRLEFREHSGDLVVEVFLRGQVGEEGVHSGVDGGELGGVLGGGGEMFGEVMGDVSVDVI
ncbi:nucleotide pyrophosphohydrolase, putative [Babesia ovata]|uniref:Nucleotide pyrophosphohydrolase, putative n=1 Tax=Babesia ovata TaxID=189622 RepID=A0A2H6KKJ6_9APIC|nr:nucleotide pyrophosphohydrolase, putative [Babesia ovata]GBE63516.1 nucleotide pyrophosphohydrolase, putative [Babesia ovata]